MTHPFRLLLPLSLAALMAASCAGSFVEEMEETETTGNVPVAFSATATDMKPDAASRAATILGEITTNTITSMGVFAYYTGAASFDGSIEANFMNNQEISRTAASQPWKYSPTKYWPNTAGEKITFLAYSPHSSHFTELDPFPNPKPEYYSYQGGTLVLSVWDNVLYFDYAPRLQAENQTDMLIAKSLMNQTKKAGPITFEFDHLLAKIVFKVKSTEKIHIDRINISEMSTYGCFYYNEDGTYAWDEIGTESGKAFYSLPNKDVPASALPTDAATPVSTFFMIPYSETRNCLLDIHYTDASGAKVEKNDVPFSYIPTKSGDVVAYTISIDKITLEVTVDPWNTTIPPSDDKLGNVRVGDYYYTDGTASRRLERGKTVDGIVYYIDPVAPLKFKVIALDEPESKYIPTLSPAVPTPKRQWATSNAYVIGANAQSLDDGKANATAIKAYFDANKGSTVTETNFEDAFPAAGYCYNYRGRSGKDAKGTWYLPAKHELQYLYCAYNGANPVNWLTGKEGAPAVDNDARSKWNGLLTAAGVNGTTISDDAIWAGTEDNTTTTSAYRTYFQLGGTQIAPKQEVIYFVRCVREIN